jgi:hypothetical protein
MIRRALVGFAVGISLFACAEASEPMPPTAAHEPEPKYARWPDPLTSMPHGDSQTARVCERPGEDSVRDVFCSGAVPSFGSLSELQTALMVDSASITGLADASHGRIAALSVSGHSTGLVARSVSAINPRVIAIRLDVAPFRVLAVAFTRGEQFVEMVTRGRKDNQFYFYLLGFRQACNDQPAGCTPGDLLTPAIESDWIETSLYDERDLQNTTLDCAPCHQSNGPGSTKILRMQELDSPWTHWFWQNSEGGRALLADYAAAKGDEPLAGMTAAQIQDAQPEALSTLVLLADPNQPNEFESQRIEEEVRLSAAAHGGMQPEDNGVPGESPTWRAAYERARRGEAISVPYHDVKVTDPTKLARMTDVYQAFRRGELAPTELPDVRDVYPDDPQRVAERGVGTEPGLSGAATLLQACSPCHSPRLDQTLSRARFRADLEDVSAGEKQLAIARMLLPPEDPRAMPPARVRVLTEAARQAAIEALKE